VLVQEDITVSKPQAEQQAMGRLLKLLSRADDPFDEDAVAMDCRDGCEEIAQLAERVANGEALENIMPAFADHMDQVGCCKEEFEALVSVIAAEEAIQAEHATSNETDSTKDDN
jgi:hypothetical protein